MLSSVHPAQHIPYKFVNRAQPTIQQKDDKLNEVDARSRTTPRRSPRLNQDAAGESTKPVKVGASALQQTLPTAEARIKETGSTTSHPAPHASSTSKTSS